MINWQLGQAFVGLLFQFTAPGSPDALLIFVAILLLSTNHDGLQCINHNYDLEALS